MIIGARMLHKQTSFESWTLCKTAARLASYGNLRSFGRSAQIVVFLIIALLGATSVASAEDSALSTSADASFKCDAARSKSEKLICSDWHLRLQDLQLDKAYRETLSVLSADDQDILRQQETNWLLFRSIQCALLDDDRAPRLIIDDQEKCLREETDNRIFFLNSIDNTYYRIPNATPFKPTKFPFTPLLLEDHDAKVCRVLLNAVRHEYFGKQPQRNPPAVDDPSIDGGVWLPMSGTYAVSLDSGTDRQFISFTHYWDSHFGEEIRLLIRDGREVNASDVKSLDYSVPLEKLQNQGWKVVFDQKGSVLDDLNPSALWFRGGLYVLLRSNVDGSNTINVPPHAIVLAKLRKNGGLSPTCITSVSAPEVQGQTPSDNSDADTPKPPQSLIQLHKSVDVLRGDGLRCIQMGPGPGGYYGLKKISGTTLDRTLNQPWQLSNSMGHDQAGIDQAIEFLTSWGYESLSRHRLSRTIFELRKTAQQDLKTYYINTFGVTERAAKSTASQAVDYILLSGLLISSQYQPPTDIDLVRAILLGHKAAVEALTSEELKHRDSELQRQITESAEVPYIKYGPEDIGEPVLFYALENVEIAKLLLEKHVDVNARNWFGKTALMYAAQFDLANTADFLLTHGADVNSSTPQTEFCNAPRITGRTALMYAAENGSPILIKRLLEAGADTHAVDSEHRDIANYLSRNDHLDPTERAELEKVFIETR